MERRQIFGRFSFASAVLLALVITIGGCSLYVNIPPHPEDQARHSPNQITVIQVETAALVRMLEDFPMPGGFNLLVPEGTSIEKQLEIKLAIAEARHIAASKTGIGDLFDPALPVVELREIRIRGGDADVDINRPSPAGGDSEIRELITVVMDWTAVSGWHGTQIQVWRFAGEPVVVPETGKRPLYEEVPATAVEPGSAEEEAAPVAPAASEVTDENELSGS